MSANILAFPTSGREAFLPFKPTKPIPKIVSDLTQPPKRYDIFESRLIRDAKLTRSTLQVLRWFLTFVLTQDVKMKRLPGTQYRWMCYKTAAQELCVSLSTIKRVIPLLTASGIIKHKTIQTQTGRRVYVAFTTRLYDFIIPAYRDKPDIKSKLEKIMIADSLIEVPKNLKCEGKPICEPVQRILEKLKELRIDPSNPKSRMFAFHLAHENAGRWTNALRDVEKFLQDIYAGRLRVSEWTPPEFLESAKSNKHLINAETGEKIRAAKGSWEAVEKLVLDAAANWRLWFDAQYEPQSKDWIHKWNPQKWFCDEYKGKRSFFLLCINRPPFRIQETFADNVYATLPDAVTEIAENFKQSHWDNFEYWIRVKSVVTWYQENAANLRERDSNAAYWLDGGLSAWFGRYVAWLGELARGGVLKAHKVGTGGNTWRAWLEAGMKAHNLRVDLRELGKP